MIKKKQIYERIGIHWMLLFFSFLAFISLGLPDGLLGVAWPSISRTFGVPLSRLAVLQMAMTFGFIFSSGNAGRLVERFGVGNLLVISNSLVVIALSGYVLAPHWYVLIISTVILGSAGGAIDAGLNAYAAERFSKEQVTLLHAFFGFGAMLGPALMGKVLSTGLPWQRGYLYTLLLVVVLLMIFILFRGLWKQDTSHAGGSPNGTHVNAPEKCARNIVRKYTAVGIAMFLMYTGLEITMGAWSFTLLTAGRNVSEAVAAVWVGAFWAGLMGGRVFFGLFGSRWHARSIVAAMIATLFIGVLLFAQPWLHWLFLPALPLIGFACAPLFPLFVSLTASVVGQASASRTIGMQVASAGLGGAVVPFFVGVSVELLSIEAIGGFALLLVAVLTVIYRIWISPACRS
ncbi:MAG: MFS transporter [Spirochaetia bacterium]